MIRRALPPMPPWPGLMAQKRDCRLPTQMMMPGMPSQPGMHPRHRYPHYAQPARGSLQLAAQRLITLSALSDARMSPPGQDGIPAATPMPDLHWKQKLRSMDETPASAIKSC